MKNLPKEELLSRLEAINRSNAIIYFDLDGYILGVNAIFLKAMGYGEEEHNQLIGKHHSIFVTYEYSKSDEYKYQSFSIATLKMTSACSPTFGFAGLMDQDHLAGVIFCARAGMAINANKRKAIYFNFIFGDI